MALRVVQNNPLPLDGTRVDPSTFLEHWVSGIDVFDIPVGGFTGGTLQFIYSQTDAPATGERRPGLLWFRRGNGRLYMWDHPDLASGVSDTFGWVSLSDRRDIWVRTAAMAPVGTPLTFDTSQSGNRLIGSGTISSPAQLPHTRCIWPCFPLNGPAAGASPPFLPQLSEFVVVALESGATNAIIPACEHGFCDFRVSSDETGAGGFARVLGGTGFNNVDNWSVLASPSGEIAGMIKGFFTDSSATDVGTNWVRPGYLFQNPPIGVTPNY